MDYDAITFDTQTIETNGFDFDGKLLAQLKQFAEGPPEVIVSEIIVQEISRHLQTHAVKAKDAVESAHRKAVLYGLKSPTESAFSSPPDPLVVAKTRLDGYLRDVGASIIPVKDAPIDEVVQRYHHGAPPFSTGKKKSEFPDAIALVSIERWAKTRDKKILAVSGDTDWQAFGDQSQYIDVVAELENALTKLQEGAEKAAEHVQNILVAMHDGTKAELATQFENLLSYELADENVTADGSSAYQFDVDSVEVKMEHYSLETDPQMVELQIVRAGRNVIVASFDLEVTVNAYASFSLSTWDSVDDEWVGLGPTTSTKEDDEYWIRVLVTFEGDFDKGEIEISKVEVIEGIGEVDFGEIEMDWGDPYLEIDSDEPDTQEPEIGLQEMGHEAEAGETPL